MLDRNTRSIHLEPFFPGQRHAALARVLPGVLLEDGSLAVRGVFRLRDDPWASKKVGLYKNMKTQLLTLDQVAQELCRSTSWVRLEIKANRLAYIKTASYWVRYDDLVDYLEQRRIQAKPDAAARALEAQADAK